MSKHTKRVFGVKVIDFDGKDILIDEVRDEQTALEITRRAAERYAEHSGGTITEATNKRDRPVWTVATPDGAQTGFYFWYPWDRPWDL